MSAIVPLYKILDFPITLAVTRSLGHAGVDTTVVMTSPAASRYVSRYATHTLVTGHTPEAFSAFSANDIVMPRYEDFMLDLAASRDLLSCRLAFPDREMLLSVIHKSSLMARAREEGIAAPMTVMPENRDEVAAIARDFIYPVILKPDRGAGGKGIVAVAGPDALPGAWEALTAEHGRMLVQERIPFSERYSVGLLCNRDGEARRACVLRAHRLYPPGTGPACCVESVVRDDLIETARGFCASIGYFGVAELEFVIDSRTGKPILMELNPRFWASVQGAITAGVDFPALLYQLVRDGDLDRSFAYRPGIWHRNVIFNDTRHLMNRLRRPGSVREKAALFASFLRFDRDDSYYIFAPDDPGPFLWMMAGYLRDRLQGRRADAVLH
ncbi:MAG: ATP-grasp domain-containing protein [Methanomicrobiaceae archaeon]|nr:ATP-grasp domain-containing protein [Methanomicrobiaceae archaeon]